MALAIPTMTPNEEARWEQWVQTQSRISAADIIRRYERRWAIRGCLPMGTYRMLSERLGVSGAEVCKKTRTRAVTAREWGWLVAREMERRRR